MPLLPLCAFMDCSRMIFTLLLLGIIPPMLHNHLHLYFAVIRRTKGRKLKKTFQKKQQGRIGYKSTANFLATHVSVNYPSSFGSQQRLFIVLIFRHNSCLSQPDVCVPLAPSLAEMLSSPSELITLRQISCQHHTNSLYISMSSPQLLFSYSKGQEAASLSPVLTFFVLSLRPTLFHLILS